MPPFAYGRDPRAGWGTGHRLGGRRCGGSRHRPLRVDEEVAVLERYQRDLEQELADVVERLRRLHRAEPEAGGPAPA